MDATQTAASESDAAESDAAESEAPTKAIPAAGAAAAAVGVAGVAAAGSTKTPTTTAADGWSTTAHEPQVIPSAERKSPGKISTPARSGRKKWPWLVGAAVLIAALVAAGIAIWFQVRPVAPADEAADAAKTYSKALEDGDLSTLRSVTCGAEQQFYTGVSDADFTRTYEQQKARNQLLKVTEVTASKVTEDGKSAVVEVVAIHTDKPDDAQQVTITLQKSGDEWKVCRPQ